MVEALNQVVDFGFNILKLNRIEAFISPDNQPSLSIITKLGFKQEGVLRSHYKSQDVIYDSVVYSILRIDYLNRL